jgi:hypothetical protein
MGKSIGGHESPKAETTTWLTPPEYIETLGPFDMDPCAAPDPRPWPTARMHVVLPEDGLAAQWHGRIWLNPPYGPEAGAWIEKLGEHGSGTALIFARTETHWFQSVWRHATAVLFLKGRVSFHYPDGRQAKANSGAPSVLIAYGQHDADRLEASGIPGQFFRLARTVSVFD